LNPTFDLHGRVNQTSENVLTELILLTANLAVAGKRLSNAQKKALACYARVWSAENGEPQLKIDESANLAITQKISSKRTALTLNKLFRLFFFFEQNKRFTTYRQFSSRRFERQAVRSLFVCCTTTKLSRANCRV